MSRKTIKKAIKWIGLLIVSHIAGMILFGLILSGSVASISEEEPAQANQIILIFNIIFDILFSILYFKIETSYIDYRKTLKDALRADDFSLLNFLRYEILKEHIIMIGIFAVFQIPFVIFYSIWGMSLLYPIIFEQFYIIDAGCYLLTDSSLLGLFLNTLIFGIIFSLIRLVFVVVLKRNLEEEIIK